MLGTMAPVIEKIETVPFAIPIPDSFTNSFTTLDRAPHVLIRVVDSDGAVGTAEASPHARVTGETIGGVLAVFRQEFEPRFVGRSIWDRERYWTELDGVVANHTAKGAFDLALADLTCRRLSVSCHRYLGGYADSVRVTHVLGQGSPEKVVEEAAWARGNYGITAFKVKVAPDLERGVECVRRVRQANPDALLYADANMGFDPIQAVEFGRRVADLNVAWVEEPVSARLPLARERAAREGGLPILGDESCTTPEEVGKEVLAGRSQLVNLKIGRSGYTGSERIRGFCETVGAPIVIGTMLDSGLGVMAAIAYGAAHRSTCQYPGEYSVLLKFEDDLLTEPVEIRDGLIRLSTAPGHGAEVDPEKLKRHRLD